VSIGGDVLPTRADRQRHKIPIYNLTTGQPLADIKGEGNLTLNFDHSAFHSLFPDAELAIVRIPKPPGGHDQDDAQSQGKRRIWRSAASGQASYFHASRCPKGAC